MKNNVKSRPILNADQINRLMPFEDQLSKFTFKPINQGYLNTEQRKVLSAVYRELTNLDAPCGSCAEDWIRKMNVWYQNSKSQI